MGMTVSRASGQQLHNVVCCDRKEKGNHNQDSENYTAALQGYKTHTLLQHQLFSWRHPLSLVFLFLLPVFHNPSSAHL